MGDRPFLKGPNGRGEEHSWAEEGGFASHPRGCLQDLSRRVTLSFRAPDLTNSLESSAVVSASHLGMRANMRAKKRGIFDEEYRVVGVEAGKLTIQGVKSGEVLTIVNHNPEVPLSAADYPPGRLIALSDPSRAPVN
jgi:hypothetical protein